ncbi:MAG: adenosine kinase [Alphaproteobacteria bacterium]
MNTNIIYDVVGIGNAIVDLLAFVDDEFLTQNKLVKGSMSLINLEDAQILSENMTYTHITAGGSAANTMIGVSSLGGTSAFIGNVTNDEFGKLFEADMIKNNVEFELNLQNNGSPTAKCFIFITPDGERTMCTYLGAAPFVTLSAQATQLIKSSKILYIESYLLDKEETQYVIKESLKIAKDHGKKIALNLSDKFCVTRHRKFLLELIENCNIIFGNKAEMLELTENNNLEEFITKFDFDDKIFVNTLGAEGALIVKDTTRAEIEPTKTNIIDLTGAGDFFASGFLFSHVIGGDLHRSATLGCVTASEIISHIGTRPLIPLKQFILRYI